MAKRYCDHGLYAAPVAAGTVPTAAEDGNGKGKTAATMATLVITFTGIPAADGTITIAGVTFTAKASGATGNQFNAVTDATTCATNLKTAINASTTNVTQPPGAIGATAPLRNVVNATSSGAVLTVYTRCAGSEWNSVTENSTLTNATITEQWSGGADGAWGYFFNTASIAWPTAVSAMGYGVMATIRPYVGSLSAGDEIIVRSAKTLTAAANANIPSTSIQSIGTITAPLRVVIDDGTEWPADGSTPVFQINWSVNSTNYLFGMPRYTQLKATKYASTYGFYMNANGSSGLPLIHGASAEYVGCYFYAPTAAVNLSHTGNSAETDSVMFRECKIQSPSGTSTLNPDSVYGYTLTLNFVETVFSNNGNASAHTGIIARSTQDRRHTYYFDSCKFEGYQPGSRLFVNAADSRSALEVFLRNCEFGGVSVLGPNPLSGAVSRKIAASSQFGNRDFFIDTAFGFVEWNSSRSFPYCNAKLLDGVTGWSIHVIPTTTSGRNSRYMFVETPRIGKINSLPDGVRTLTVEIAIHDSLVWNKSHISAVIDYLDTSGVRQVVDTFDYDGGALTTSTATWNQESGGQVTFVDGTTQYHNKYKFSVTTPTSIATGTEIGIMIRCHTYVDSVVKGFFIDPEIQVA